MTKYDRINLVMLLIITIVHVFHYNWSIINIEIFAIVFVSIPFLICWAFLGIRRLTFRIVHGFWIGGVILDIVLTKYGM